MRTAFLTVAALACAACVAAAQSPATLSAPVPAAERTNTDRGFRSADGREIPGALSVPPGKGPFPVLVTIHGGAGGREAPVLRYHGWPTSSSPVVRALNEQPWAIYSIDYRAGGLFGLEEDDVLAGIRSIANDPRIDRRRIAVFGGSHGGYLALRAAIRLGNEISCVAAGSPWMTDPELYFLGDPAKPPLSTLPPKALAWLLQTRARLSRGVERQAGVAGEAALARRLAERSVVNQIDRVRVPTLFLTSRADVQVNHRIVEPTIERRRAAGGGKVESLVLDESLHGFYWANEGDFGARQGNGPKTDAQRAEEVRSRETLVAFMRGCLGGRR